MTLCVFYLKSDFIVSTSLFEVILLKERSLSMKFLFGRGGIGQ